MSQDTPSQPLKTMLSDYGATVEETDTLPKDDLRPAVLGLFGEVGGVMATAKKLHREKKAFPLYREAATEEFGDALWYLTAIANRLNLRLSELIVDESLLSDVVGPDLPVSAFSSEDRQKLDDVLLEVGRAASRLIESGVSSIQHADVRDFAQRYVEALRAARLSFAEIVRENKKKALSRFGPLDLGNLPTFDEKFHDDERLPAEFEIRISQRTSGKAYLQWNGVFIGDPLTDNIADSDGYRFHDVFHFAHAAILHWSPVFRALIKQKRKSDKVIDETEDSGRPIVVEEGLTAWLFSQAKALDYFAGQSHVSYDILKTIGSFVRGYEVQDCPLNLWEQAILQGYEVFRKVRDNAGGIVIGNRARRTLEYRPLS